MVRVPHCFRVAFDSGRRAAAGRRLAVAATLAAALVGVVGEGSVAAQAGGCSRCITIGPFSFPNPFAAPAPAPVERASRSYEGPRRKMSSLRPHSFGQARGAARPGGVQAGYSISVCVRTCDGSFFPLPYAGASGASLEQICQALCPNAEMALYSMPFGGTIDESVSPTGARYTALPNAEKFEQSYDPSCSCRRPGQSWADALASAEARFGHRAHEVVVTEEASVQMSRPKIDPAAKAAKPAPQVASNAPDAEVVSGALADEFADPDLDANGVDTKLRAATAAVSRETSGIRDDAGEAGSRFGLREGRIVQEDDPDGGLRRVRVLNPLF